uniref:Uncharacterized protein n=1 Tax=Cacopsylla melanoneura TaxID=428564 RepID=A0A8D8PUN0_9HEMI
MNIHAENGLLLLSGVWLSLGLVMVQCEPQKPHHQNVAHHKTETKTKGYKIEDLPGLSEHEIDANANELKELIRSYGPKALLVFNHTKYYKKGFEENFSDYDRETESVRRWTEFMSFFDTIGGMKHFKTWWWPRYQKPITRPPRKTKSTPDLAVFWNPDVAEKYFGVKDDDDEDEESQTRGLPSGSDQIL